MARNYRPLPYDVSEVCLLDSDLTLEAKEMGITLSELAAELSNMLAAGGYFGVRVLVPDSYAADDDYRNDGRLPAGQVVPIVTRAMDSVIQQAARRIKSEHN